MRRRNNPFSNYRDSEQKLRHRTTTESILTSYFELYVRRLLPEHRFTEEFLDLLYSNFSEEQLRSISIDLLGVLAQKPGISGDVLESAERFSNELEIESEPKDIISSLLVGAEKCGFRKEAVKVLEKHCGLAAEPLDDIGRMDRFQAVASAFLLDTDELNLILFLFLAGTNDTLGSVVGVWSSHEKPRGMGICIGVPESRMHEILSAKSRLRSNNLVEFTMRNALDISLYDELNEYLAAPGAGSLYEQYLKPAGISNYTLNSFPVRASERALCRTLLGGNAPVQILLHGSEGTGKTEFAKSLVLDSGKTPYVLDRSEDSRKTNLVQLTLAQAALPKSNSVIIVDEADAMLDGGRRWLADLMLGDKEEKARINTFMDQARCPVIWIVNSIEGVQASTLRRFAFSVEFKPLKPAIIADRVAVALAHIPISDRVKKHAVALASSRELTGAAVANLCTTLEGLALGSTEEGQLMEYVSALFAANSTLVSGKAPRANKVNAAYDVSVLNVSMEPGRIIRAVGINIEKTEEKSGLRILFHGIPGTGKTEFARYIAQESGRKLDIRRSSDILSPYVGIAEKNIAAMFSDAEESGDILLIDEADAFLYDRAKARQSWEVTQVNEFLARMEEFRGVLICTTNRLAALDQAVIRRFQIKTEFLPLKQECAEQLLKSFFPEMSFDSEALKRLSAQRPYVPGDYSVVQGLRATLAEEDFSPVIIIDALIAEAKHRKTEEKTIGFSA